jgi:hypothetical protein
MPLNLASPGILIREVDLTIGRIDPVSASIGALVAPFARGPVLEPKFIENENDLLNTFGKPYSVNKHYEHWMVASSYLAYGGTMQIVRTDDENLKTAFYGEATDLKVKSLEHYTELGYLDAPLTDVTVMAQNPGSWANGVSVAMIDARADQILTGFNTTGVSVTAFVGVATASDGDLGITTTTITGITTTGIASGQTLKILSGVIGSGTTVTSIGVGTVYLNKSTLNAVALDNVQLSFGSYSTTIVSTPVQVGYAVTQAINTLSPGVGTTERLDGYLKGIITGIGASTVDVKLLTHVSAAGTERPVDYQLRGVYNFADNGIVAIHTTGSTSSYGSVSYANELDWFDQQTCIIGIQTTKNNAPTRVNWNALAPRPGTSEFAAERNSRFDEVHIIVIDAEGKITGNSGTILEKHLSLSKASDALYSSGSPSYWRKYLTTASQYIFAGSTPVGIVTTGFSESENYELSTDNDWDQNTQDIIFGCCGALDMPLTGGRNYDGGTDILSEGSLEVELGDIITACDEFLNEDEIDIDFLLMGSAGYDKTDCQAWASKMIAVAEARKDTVAFISPYRGSAITDTSTQTATTIRDVDTITDNVVSFYAPVPSSSYAVFDSGYKYMYDRFNNTFRYVPLNGDIAGCCARNDVNNFPWYSPGGTSRGTILNSVKLAYNPGRKQRDKLYTNRINPVIVSPGAGIILFGDKTGYGKSSAFDRINVRRLFIYLENAIAAAAKDQLFEFNDEITRTNFVNIVEPFLRDVQSKRGIYDYVVICDETNNTPAIIDANEFVADIYIKPARSINFIGLTFIATRTGVAFEEVIGNF